MEDAEAGHLESHVRAREEAGHVGPAKEIAGRVAVVAAGDGDEILAAGDGRRIGGASRRHLRRRRQCAMPASRACFVMIVPINAP
jgi:hypothetical protein